ncbi:MAG: protein DpdH [Candidatus Bipolaricaulia bacterium]
MESQPREHTLVIPIVGEPGTGKSHIIRWLRAAIGDRDDFVVRHIPREGTSLPQVVRILLEGLDGGRFDEVRQQMESAKSRISSLEEAANHLALRISEVIEYDVPSVWNRATRFDAGIRRDLCDSKGLPALLTDPVCRSYLIRVGGPIHRIAGDIVDGYRKPDDEDSEELGFRPDDLKFSTANLRGAGAPARTAAKGLLVTQIAEAAAAILSDALDVAAKDVIGLGEVSLADVFEDLRAGLMEQGKQLILLFEDMAIMRGLQSDLVDAITTPAVRDGEQRLCTMRVALAITPTYWDEQAETLATRVQSWGGGMFSLDVPMDEDDTDEVVEMMIGRYLNAARVGIEELESQEVVTPGEAPNACQSCRIRQKCHPVFGATSEGHGLYPLTRTAARKAARLASLQQSTNFRPRAVLSEVVAPVISERTRLDEGAFPSVDGRLKALVDGAIQRGALKDLQLAQREALEAANLTDTDKMRAETVLRLWDVRGSASGVKLLGALNLPDVVTGVSVTTPTDDPSTDDPERPVVTPPRRDAELEAIDQWAGGKVELPQAVAREVRKALFWELAAGIRWEEIGFGEEAVMSALGLKGNRAQMPNRAVAIKKAGGGGAIGDAKPLIALEPNATSARLLRGLLLHSRHSSWAFVGGVDALARLRMTVREVEAHIIARLDETAFSRKVVTDTAQVLMLAATSLGAADPTEDSPLSGSLTPSETLVIPEGRTSEWTAFAREAQKVHGASLEALRAAVGRRQGPSAGRSGITAFDWTRIDGRRLTRSGDALLRVPKHEAAQQLYRALMRTAESAVAREAEAISGLVSSIERRIGPGAPLTLKKIRDAAQEAIEETTRAQVLRPTGAPGELARIELPSSVAAAALLEDARLAVTAGDSGLSREALSRIAKVNTVSLERIAQYLELLDDLVEQSQEAALGVIGRGPVGGEGTTCDLFAMRFASRSTMSSKC